MSIPINGRVAIIDDQILQAKPIMEELSKRQCPCTYYSGELKYLPEQDESANDIRVLFLDIYLTGDEARSDKEVKSSLVPVLQRVIPKDNFPYLIVYWSRHEDDHRKLIQEIFENDLIDRKPITYLSVDKTQFFKGDGETTNNFETNLEKLWDQINTELNSITVYNYLLDWENSVHKSADKTIEDVFLTIKDKEEWEKNANKLFRSLGISHAGKHFFNMSPVDQNKNSLYTLGSIFKDTIEHAIETSTRLDKEIPDNDIKVESSNISNINSKLLIQKDTSFHNYSGTVIESDEDDYKKNVFNNIINYGYLEKTIRSNNEGESKNKIKNLCSDFRSEMRENWKKIWVVVTPLCDFIQKKAIYTKIVRGVLIEEKYMNYLDTNSEAVFISPSFEFDDKIYVLVLQLRNYLSIKGNDTLYKQKILFRVRQNLLVEIQSKLSRHINRQGVLFLDHNLL